jgi:FkbM family methyltransferase
MASVQSPLRRLAKPLIYKALGPWGYQWMLTRAKIRDIDKRLVEEPEMAILPDLVKDGSAILDIGANYAYYSVRLARLCPNSHVHAFEPIPATAAVCRKILEHYALHNVTLHQKGVGARNERLSFEVPLQDAGTLSAGQAHILGRRNDMAGREKYHSFTNHATFDCEVVALDDFLADLTTLGFVKMDIEGAEYFALEGMRKLLERYRPIILIEICSFFLKGFGIDLSKLVGLISELGYEIYSYDMKLTRVPLPSEDRNYILIPDRS